MQLPPHVSSHRVVGPKEKSSSPFPAIAIARSPLRSASCLVAPLSPLHRRTSRPTSYRPVSPASSLSRCSQPRGKSSTGAPAHAPCRSTCSATANSPSTDRLWPSQPLSPPPRAPPWPGVPLRPLQPRRRALLRPLTGGLPPAELTAAASPHRSASLHPKPQIGTLTSGASSLAPPSPATLHRSVGISRRATRRWGTGELPCFG
jgi:hypothetical protein